MTKRLLFVLSLAAFGVVAWAMLPTTMAAPPADAAAAPAKAPPLMGTVASIKGLRVEITVEGEKPDWVKRGSGVKVNGGLGKIVDLTATTVAFNTKKASTLKVGEKLTVEKGTVVPAGC